MRIGFDAHVLDGRNQGTKTLMLRLIDTLARRHPEHEMFIYSEALHPELDFSLANLHHRPTVRQGQARYLLQTLPQVSRIDALDTMVFNFIQSPLLRNATVMMHDILPQTHPRFFSLRFVVRCWLLFAVSSFQARYMFTISDHSRKEIRRIYPWTRRKTIGVLHIGPSFPVETYFAGDGGAPLPVRSPTGRYVLVVGRIEARKNVQTAIDAFRAGAPEDVSLVIVGHREPGIAIDTYGDPRIIELTGISDAELVTLYRRAALFLYPSVAEGFGLPLLDAILFGVPVISSQRTSMEEVGADCAVFFDPTAQGATDWLGARIAAHFGGDPVPTPAMSAREERAALYSWANAADELLLGICAK